MTFFRYKADRLPIAVFATYFALDVAVYLMISNFWLLLGWLLLGIFPKACICAWNHHHQHVLTFKQKWLNRLLELVYGFQTGVTSNAWVLHHTIGHHQNYLDQTKDESRWKRLDGTAMGEIEYSLNVALTAYPRAYKVGTKYKKPLKTFLWMGALQVALLAGLFAYNWMGALMVFLLPMMISLYMTANATFGHHSGLDTDNEFEASYNIMNPAYNILTGNLGYHTAHHVKCAVHWSKLPEYHATIADKIPAHLYKKPGFPLSLFEVKEPANASAS
jgi:fatty acid desaturase